jgi:hypothetical protein
LNVLDFNLWFPTLPMLLQDSDHSGSIWRNCRRKELSRAVMNLGDSLDHLRALNQASPWVSLCAGSAAVSPFGSS